MRFLILNDGGFEGFENVTFPIEVGGTFGVKPEEVWVQLTEVLPHGYDMTYKKKDIGNITAFVFYTDANEIKLLRKF